VAFALRAILGICGCAASRGGVGLYAARESAGAALALTVKKPGPPALFHFFDSRRGSDIRGGYANDRLEGADV
jgi:hypothetical protein